MPKGYKNYDAKTKARIALQQFQIQKASRNIWTNELG
jgi:hypothetical protein